MKSIYPSLSLVKDLEDQGNKLFGKNISLSSKPTAEVLFKFIYLYESIVPQLDSATKKLFAAGNKNDDTNFKHALEEFKLAKSQLNEVIKELKSKITKKRLKIHDILFSEALQAIDQLENFITEAEKVIK